MNVSFGIINRYEISTMNDITQISLQSREGSVHFHGEVERGKNSKYLEVH